ncbi:MAG: peptide deformylase [Kiritimatiellia bacterium]|jgi:peptide deformylase
MAVHKILKLGHPTLRQRARELTTQELSSDRWQGFIDDLVHTMHHANGAGLAAIQIGEPVRVVAIHVKPNNPRYPYKPAIPLTVAVNPVLRPIGGEQFTNYEGCLSVVDLRGVVPRYKHLSVTYLDRHGVSLETTVHGVTAGTWQHEVDHLDGKLFVDRVSDTETLTTWANFDAFHRERFVRYIQGVVDECGQ